jgi:hypothetical protein
MKTMNCPQCTAQFEARVGHANRAAKTGAPLYCGRACAGLARRRAVPLSEAERKEAKRVYDAARRLAKHAELCAKKRDHYYANREPIKAKQTVYRAKHMQRHVEYCRRPEYREWKKSYDRTYTAKQKFGEFADAFLLLQDIENEVAARATRYEIYSANGTLNKAQTRRRSL